MRPRSHYGGTLTGVVLYPADASLANGCKPFGDSLRAAAAGSKSGNDEEVVVRLDWRESMPHPDARVEYEFWTNSNDECGPRCDEQAAFVSAFRGHAQLLEKAGDALFTPHYITWFCPAQFQGTRQCASQCINHGRYRAPDPEGDLGAGYEGKDVVVENLRQLCVHRVAKARMNASWVWWDFVTDYLVFFFFAGKLESTAVLKAICAGYKEMTEPRVCLTQDMETDQCLNNNGSCWRDDKTNITACKDTYRGRVCECPVVEGVQYYEGDGYKKCRAVSPGRCAVINGGCWKDTRHGKTFSACAGSESLSGCQCPPGFRGDGLTCEDVDECSEKLACSCPHCHCRNTWGGHHCWCRGDDMVYIRDQDTCVGKNTSAFGWMVTALMLSCLVGAGAIGFAFYKYRLRSYMDSEVAAIMSQYMPLESHSSESRPLREEAVEA